MVHSDSFCGGALKMAFTSNIWHRKKLRTLCALRIEPNNYCDIDMFKPARLKRTAPVLYCHLDRGGRPGRSALYEKPAPHHPSRQARACQQPCVYINCWLPPGFNPLDAKCPYTDLNSSKKIPLIAHNFPYTSYTETRRLLQRKPKYWRFVSERVKQVTPAFRVPPLLKLTCFQSACLLA